MEHSNPAYRSREHFMAEFGSVIRDPIAVPLDPIPCLKCKAGVVGQVESGKASCSQCAAVHGFMVIQGKIRYGLCL